MHGSLHIRDYDNVTFDMYQDCFWLVCYLWQSWNLWSDNRFHLWFTIDCAWNLQSDNKLTCRINLILAISFADGSIIECICPEEENWRLQCTQQYPWEATERVWTVSDRPRGICRGCWRCWGEKRWSREEGCASRGLGCRGRASSCEGRAEGESSDQLHCRSSQIFI